MDLLGSYSSDEKDDDAPTNDTSKKRRTSPGRVRLVTSTEEKDLFVRTIPHTRGNWAGHVFVKVSPCHNRSAQQSVSDFCVCLENAGWEGTVFSHESNLHLSLSRPFFLQLSSISSFVNSLKEKLTHEHATRLVVTGEKLLVNDEGTRSFWCWIVRANPSIHRILNHINKVLVDYQQSPYYESPEFHVSVASLAGNVQALLDSPRQRDIMINEASLDNTHNGDGDDDDDDDNSGGPLMLTIDHIYCTFGTTKTYRIDLSP